MLYFCKLFEMKLRVWEIYDRILRCPFPGERVRHHYKKRPVITCFLYEHRQDCLRNVEGVCRSDHEIGIKNLH